MSGVLDGAGVGRRSVADLSVPASVLECGDRTPLSKTHREGERTDGQPAAIARVVDEDARPWTPDALTA